MGITLPGKRSMIVEMRPTPGSAAMFYGNGAPDTRRLVVGDAGGMLRRVPTIETHVPVPGTKRTVPVTGTFVPVAAAHMMGQMHLDRLPNRADSSVFVVFDRRTALPGLEGQTTIRAAVSAARSRAKTATPYTEDEIRALVRDQARVDLQRVFASAAGARLVAEMAIAHALVAKLGAQGLRGGVLCPDGTLLCTAGDNALSRVAADALRAGAYEEADQCVASCIAALARYNREPGRDAARLVMITGDGDWLVIAGLALVALPAAEERAHTLIDVMWLTTAALRMAYALATTPDMRTPPECIYVHALFHRMIAQLSVSTLMLFLVLVRTDYTSGTRAPTTKLDALDVLFGRVHFPTVAQLSRGVLHVHWANLFRALSPARLPKMEARETIVARTLRAGWFIAHMLGLEHDACSYNPERLGAPHDASPQIMRIGRPARVERAGSAPGH